MSTTDTSPTAPPPPAPGPTRRLRRSRSGRVGAGVAAGLGDYFGLDPLLFRVLFATSAFFGGAGVIAYLVAWAVIPEEGTERAAVDHWIGELRRRRVPAWAVVVVGALVLWAVAFSWWAPGPFVPVLVVVVLLLVAYGRRGGSAPRPTAPSDATGGVDLTKRSDGPDATTTAPGGEPAWYGETRGWLAEQRAASQERRRRAAPIRIAVLVTLAATLLVLGVVDAAHGIALPLYFVVTAAIVLVGLLVGLVARRTPWSTAALLVPAAAGLVAFAGTSARLHDGIGQTQWEPRVKPAASYRLALGQATLDLRSLAAQDRPRTVHLTMAAGQLRILAPSSLNLTVRAHVHLGDVSVDGNGDDGPRSHGVNYSRTVRPGSGATGAPITVIARLADGHISIERG